jgi:NAD/NADP transhydrogenase beta subunit
MTVAHPRHMPIAKHVMLLISLIPPVLLFLAISEWDLPIVAALGVLLSAMAATHLIFVLNNMHAKHVEVPRGKDARAYLDQLRMEE